jgi:flagellar hook-basal body complex protein FliE
MAVAGIGAAINAYASAQAQATKAAGSASAMGGAEGGGNFGDMLKQVMGDAVNSSKHAEQAMAAQVSGKAELVDVVTAISSAEASMETVMAVRDQVISAYQEIMRMPI